jgi:hypothetical protein
MQVYLFNYMISIVYLQNSGFVWADRSQVVAQAVQAQAHF